MAPEHRRVCFALALVILGTAVRVAAGPCMEVTWVARHEVRGLWVVRTSMRTRSSVERVVALASSSNFNALFVQVNGRGEAYYTSAVLPKAPDVEDGFDPLAFCIERAHAAGLQVHAWINAFTVGKLGCREYEPGHVLSRHPEWALTDDKGVSTLDYSQEMAEGELVSPMLDPAIEGVKAYVHDVFMEVVRNYDVDGVHFDYIRYPSPRFGYGAEAKAAFRDLAGPDRADLGQGEWDAFRRDQVTEVVRRVYQDVKRVKPWVAVSCAVLPDAADAAERTFQDWKTWLDQDIVDFVVPMAYAPDEEIFVRRVRDAVGAASGWGRVVAGIGAYNMLDDPAGCIERVEAARSMKTAGVVLFSYDAISDRPEYWQALADGPFRTRVPAPVLARNWNGWNGKNDGRNGRSRERAGAVASEKAGLEARRGE